MISADTESQLIDAILHKNDTRAVSKLYREYLPLVYGYTVQRVGSRQDAEDITSQVFLIMVQSLSTYEGRSSFKNWLFGIVKTLLKEYWRKEYPRKSEIALEKVIHSLGAWDSEPSRPDDVYEKQRIKMMQIINRLDEKYRLVVQCRIVERMSVRETAQKLNLSTSNVKVIQYRAIKKASELSAN